MAKEINGHIQAFFTEIKSLKNDVIQTSDAPEDSKFHIYQQLISVKTNILHD